jgi:hypothetical protein
MRRSRTIVIEGDNIAAGVLSLERPVGAQKGQHDVVR